MARPLRALPKAHLHLHLTGAMRHTTLVELAREHRVQLPAALADDWPLRLAEASDERGWFRFQRLYDIARSVLRTEDDVRRLLRETAEDEAADGSGWLEIQVDPSGYAARFGGLTPTVELVLDAAAQATAATGVGIGVIIAANRTKHPLEARTLARLAAQYAGRGVIGFGLSNDERRGVDGRVRARLPHRRPGRAAVRPARRRAVRPGQRPGLPGRPARRPDRARHRRGRGPGAGPAAGRTAASPSRSARRPTWRSASSPSPPTCRCRSCWTRACRSRWAPTTRCCSAPGSPPSTSWPRTALGLGDAELAELARMSVRGSRGPRRGARQAAGRHRRLAGRPAGAGPRLRARRRPARARGLARCRTTARTPSRISAASASRSLVLPPPGLTSASVCLAEIRTAAPAG